MTRVGWGLAVLTAGALAVPALAAAPAGAGCRPAHYRVRALPLHPAAINEHGDIAGTTEDRRAAVWSARGVLREIPLPAGFATAEAVALNDHGHAVVVAHDATLTRHATYLYAGGKLTPLAGDQARGIRVNDADAVAGESLVEGSRTSQPVVWERGGRHPLGGCCGGTAVGINRDGDVAADLYDEQGRYAAFLWTRKQGLVRVGPPGRFSSALALNARGHVVVQGFPGVYLYSPEGLTALELSPQSPSHPRALNDCDVIVGAFGPYSDAYRAFVWDAAGGFQDLNMRIPAGGDWKLEAAVGINNRGEIVGKGDWRHHEDRGFLLIPD